MHEVQARNTGEDLWLRPLLADLAEAHQTPDDADFEALVSTGGLGDEVVPFQVVQHGRAGDLVWTVGSYIKVASTRLVDALTRVGATGFTTYPITVDDATLAGRYVGFAVASDSDGDVRPVHDDGPFWSFTLSAGAMQALREAGVDGFEEV